MLMDEKDYETKIGELELKIEEMEKTNGTVYGLFLGVLSYFQWHNIIVSILIALITIFIMLKYVAQRPFTKNIKNIRSE